MAILDERLVKSRKLVWSIFLTIIIFILTLKKVGGSENLINEDEESLAMKYAGQQPPSPSHGIRSILWHWADLADDKESKSNDKKMSSEKFDSNGGDINFRSDKNDNASNLAKRGAEPVHEAYYDTKPSIRAVSVSCYSCMSLEFEKYWSTLRTMYNQPKNFSDLCLDLPRRSRIGTQQCDSACLTVLERRFSGGTLVSGRPSGYNVIRGCLSNVYKSYVGPNTKLISLRRKTSTTRRSICEDMDARDLLPLPPKTQSDGEKTGASGSGGGGGRTANNPLFRASLCTCYGELCNNQPLSGCEQIFNLRIFFFVSISFYLVYEFILRAISYR